MDIKQRLFTNSYHVVLIGLGLGIIMALDDYLSLDISQNIRFVVAGVIGVSGYVFYEKYSPNSSKSIKPITPATLQSPKIQKTQTPDDIYNDFINKQKLLKKEE